MNMTRRKFVVVMYLVTSVAAWHLPALQYACIIFPFGIVLGLYFAEAKKVDLLEGALEHATAMIVRIGIAVGAIKEKKVE